MQLKIVSFGQAEQKNADALLATSKFRKATRAMALSCASIEAAIAAEPLLSRILASAPERFGLALGSAFGELETTKDFLKTWADIGVARPMLFQNSLHNSTSGFASIHFRFTGPVVTVSHGWFAFEQAIEVASLVLSQKPCDFVMITYVEVFIPDLLEQRDVINQSSTIIVTRADVTAAEGLKVLGSISDVSCVRTPKSEKPSYQTAFLAAPTSSQVLIDAIRSTSMAPLQLRVRKSETDYSLISWSRE